MPSKIRNETTVPTIKYNLWADIVRHSKFLKATDKNSYEKPTLYKNVTLLGGVYKAREQTRGRGLRGVAQMTTTLNNSYLVKVPT